MARPLASILTNVSSYDPLSPSYDPYVPSPCTSFPIALPFLPAHFKKTQVNANANAFLGQASLTVPDQGISVNERLALLSRIPPPHSAPSLRRTKLCRFYLDPSGCKSGRWCNFKHPVVDVRSSSELSQLDHSSQNWDNVPDVRDLNSNWRKEKDGEVHPKFRSEFGVLISNFFTPHLKYYQQQLNRAEILCSVYAVTVADANLSTLPVSYPLRRRCKLLSQPRWKLPILLDRHFTQTCLHPRFLRISHLKHLEKYPAKVLLVRTSMVCFCICSL